MSDRIYGRSVTLVPATPELHVQQLLAWRNGVDWLDYCTHRSGTCTEAEFRAEMARDFSDDRWLQYMIVNASGEFMGTIFAYGLNDARTSTFITTYVDERFRGGTAATHAFVLLTGFLFFEHSYRLETVRADVYQSNKRSWGPLCKGGFRVETIVPSRNGKSKMRLALHAHSLDEHAQSLLRFVRAR